MLNVKGARLIRKMTEEELRRKEDALRMANKGGADSISVKTLDVSDTYSVGIELEKALANSGSDFDMVLREGDIFVCAGVCKYRQNQWCCDVSQYSII